MESSRYLYVCYINFNDSIYHFSSVYCLASSVYDVTTLVEKFCIEKLGYPSGSFSVSDPLLISNFIE